jgi:ADP-heptose:LPS heptosyltransferase
MKVLIIRFSSIGDIVLTSPVPRCIRKQYPDSVIHYLTKAPFRSLLENSPYIDKIFTITSKADERISQLQAENYDHIIDLHNNIRSLQVRKALQKPSTVFRKLNLKKWLLVNFKIDLMPAQHVVDRYLETVQKLGVSNDHQGLDYFIPEKDELPLDTLPSTFGKGYIAFVIGAKHGTKQLPTDKLIRICKQLRKPIVLLGGKEDQELAAAVTTAVGENCFNACGRYNLNQSASLVRQSETVISHDTGLMHIAAALGKRVISVWGNTVPALGFSPYKPGQGSVMLEVTGLDCRPCSKIGYNKCPEGHFRCMREHNEEFFSSL